MTTMNKKENFVEYIDISTDNLEIEYFLKRLPFYFSPIRLNFTYYKSIDNWLTIL